MSILALHNKNSKRGENCHSPHYKRLVGWLRREERGLTVKGLECTVAAVTQ